MSCPEILIIPLGILLLLIIKVIIPFVIANITFFLGATVVVAIFIAGLFVYDYFDPTKRGR